ncbi:MAG TPA: hypothetical protein VHJ17_03720 [Thermomonospora sp.]|nr:hypothetical protein [Thermomonospora sp.]
MRPTPHTALLPALLCLFAALLAVWSTTGGDVLLVPLVAVGLTVFATGVALAASRAKATAPGTDAARLAELEPLPPTAAEEDGT